LTKASCQDDPDGVDGRPREFRAKLEIAVGDDALPALVASRELREALAGWEATLARRALAAGETWESIGAGLGMTRQAAWERLRPAVAAEIEGDRTRIAEARARLASDRRKRNDR
jgi:hypothetical protein